MTIPLFAPAVQVTLLKLVQRKEGVAARYAGADRTIDLTPFLGDGGEVTVSKSLRGEAAGSFSVTVPDRMNTSGADTLYALVEAMDMVEIRMAREPHLYAGGKLPLVLRGFVSAVRRPETVDGTGRPQRVVSIIGHDMGKLWLIQAIWYELAHALNQPVIDKFGLLIEGGLRATAQTVGEFMTSMCNDVMNKAVEKLSAYTNRTVPKFIPDVSVTEGSVIPEVMALQLGSGNYWSVISSLSDPYWNELFIEDHEDGPHLVFRPMPAHDLAGKLILPGAKEPGNIAMDINEAVVLDVTRSDSRIANWFWVHPGDLALDTNMMATASTLAVGDGLDFEYPNNAPELYGYRRMDATTSLIPTTVPTVPSAQPNDKQPQGSDLYSAWFVYRARQLRDLNRDNGVFEEGAIRCMGSERFAVGKYLVLTRGDLVAEYYITSISHSFTVFGGWVTSLSVERGTGFLVRNRMTDSPYLAEGRRGPYSDGPAVTNGGRTAAAPSSATAATSSAELAPPARSPAPVAEPAGGGIGAA